MLDCFEFSEDELKKQVISAMQDCGPKDSLFLVLLQNDGPKVVKFDANYITEIYEQMEEIPPALLLPADPLNKLSDIWEPLNEASDILVQTMLDILRPRLEKRLYGEIRTISRKAIRRAAEKAPTVLAEIKAKRVVIMGPTKEQFLRVTDELPEGTLELFEFEFADEQKKAPKGADIYVLWTKFIAHKSQEQVESVASNDSDVILMASFNSEELNKALLDSIAQ